jgi:hypothetical protein
MSLCRWALIGGSPSAARMTWALYLPPVAALMPRSR